MRTDALSAIRRPKDSNDRNGVQFVAAKGRPAVVEMRALRRRDKVDCAQAEADEAVVWRDGLCRRRSACGRRLLLDFHDADWAGGLDSGFGRSRA